LFIFIFKFQVYIFAAVFAVCCCLSFGKLFLCMPPAPINFFIFMIKLRFLTQIPNYFIRCSVPFVEAPITFVTILNIRKIFQNAKYLKNFVKNSKNTKNREKTRFLALILSTSYILYLFLMYKTLVFNEKAN